MEKGAVKSIALVVLLLAVLAIAVPAFSEDSDAGTVITAQGDCGDSAAPGIVTWTDEEEAVGLTPAAFFTGKAAGITVNVIAAAGAFDQKVEMELTPIYDSAVLEKIAVGVEAKAQNVTAIDIAFVNADGDEVEPLAPIKVAFISDAIGETAKIAHLNNNGSIEVMDAEIGDGMAAFESDAFSVYAVVDARLLVEFRYPDGTLIASMYVKNGDSLGQLIYDPGVTLDDGVFFRGWTEEQNYDSTTEALTIADIRGQLATAVPTEGGVDDDVTFTYYAMLFRSYEITYFDDHEIVLGQEAVVFRADDTVDTHQYKVNMAYTVPSTELNFEGWLVIDGSSNIVGYVEGTTPPYQNNDIISISGDVDFGVSAPKGHWLVFDENGKGATYNAAHFYKATERTKKPCEDEEMTRFGYTFGGWYKDKACTDGNEFTFGSTLTEFTTIYAKWIPNETAGYTILIWKQKVSAAGGTFSTANYDFAASYTGTGAVGASIVDMISIGTLGDLKFVTLGGTRYGGVQSVSSGTTTDPFTGFTLNEDELTDAEIAVDGSSVVNIYFDRVEYTLKMYVTRTNANGGQVRGSSSYQQGGQYGGNWSTTLSNITQINGSAPTTFDTTNNLRYYYYSITAYYGAEITTWPEYADITSRPEFVSWILMPTAKAFLATANTVKGTISIMDEQVLGNLSDKDGNYLTARYSNNNNDWTYYIYFADAQGRYPDDNQPSKTIVLRSSDFSSDGQYQHPPAYNGYTNDSSMTKSGARPYFMRYYYMPNEYEINFMDGVYVDGNGSQIGTGQSQIELVTGIVYGADVSDYNSHEPTDVPEGFVFEGWYMDTACNQPFTFDNMPEGGLTVYAKWRQIQYRVFLHPNYPDAASGDINWGNSEQAMNFRVSYGGKISSPTGRLNGYEFVGWFTDEACTQVFNGNAIVLNEDTVTADYDKDTTPTDPYDINGKYTGDPNNIINSDKENGRFWITKKYDVYAKWRTVLDGASGIGVSYNLNGGTGSVSDTNLYVDGASSLGAAAVNAPAGQKFAYWVVQKWDVDGYVDTNIKVFQDGTFEVKAEFAKVEVITNPQTDDTNKYTVQLKAVYVDKGVPSLAQVIYWFNNDGTDAYEDKNLKINEGVDIHNPQAREGYTFLGWARIDINAETLEEAAEWAVLPASKTNENLGAGDLYLYYINNKYYVDSTADTKATQVAADLVRPYNAMYAIWEINKYTVTVVAQPEGYGTVSVAKFENVPYGTSLSASGATFTVAGIGSSVATATATAAGEQYSYAFVDWTIPSEAVGGDVTVYANFSRAVNKYTVTLVSSPEDAKTFTPSTYEVEWGTAISADGKTLTIGEGQAAITL
ncbi:MAG: InlB B-repeat-containing protein, partial [Candidatus Methanomethylophilaceae archaeon]|nr:InlB B-repeat-containing protein [Candidatus Methanomethylophilaceae archaeon]